MALGRDDAEATIAAGLCLTRLLSPAEAIATAGPWILATMAERLELPPAGTIADLGALVASEASGGANTGALLVRGALGSMRAGTGMAGEDAALATARRRYEDAVLGRLAFDRRLAAAVFAVARLPPSMQASAVGILVAGVLSRVRFEGGVEVQPGAVRRLASIRTEDALKLGYDVLRDDAVVRQRLAAGYSAFARAAQQARELIGDAELFALENLEVLGSLTQRLAVLDVLSAQEAIARTMPRALGRRRRNEGDVASSLEDESVYPVGGFASMSTSGSLENLVSSELIYMDPPSERRAGVDLFDLRYVESELLYYTRDESILVRRRRLVIIALAPDLVRARVKDRALPWQRIVLVLGAVLVVVRKLVELLGEEALEIRVVFIRESGRTGEAPLAQERALAELMLREWRERGLVEVLEATWEAVTAAATTNARRSLVEVVRIGARSFDLPAVFDSRVIAVDFVPPAETLEAWSKATADLLATLL